MAVAEIFPSRQYNISYSGVAQRRLSWEVRKWFCHLHHMYCQAMKKGAHIELLAKTFHRRSAIFWVQKDTGINRLHRAILLNPH